jgi:hypothetical protein
VGARGAKWSVQLFQDTRKPPIGATSEMWVPVLTGKASMGDYIRSLPEGKPVGLT